MAEAMGTTGIEGPFRIVCNIIMKIIQQNVNLLLAIVRPVVHDATFRDVMRCKFEKGEFISHAVRALLLFNIDI